MSVATDQARFQEEMRTLLKERIGIACVVGSFVFPFFVEEDRMLVPDDWQRVMAWRVACSLTCLLGAALNHTRLVRQHTFAFIVGIMAVVSVMKVFATSMDVTGLQTLYLGGHVLILIGGLAFLPIPVWQAALVAGTCILGYAATHLLFSTHIDPKAFQIQIGLLVAMSVLLSLGCHFNYKLRFREFLFRNALYRARRRTEDYGWDAGAGGR